MFLCGTPGGYHGDLIEAEWESGQVYLGNADTIKRPLRLGVDEALALIVGLRALAAVPGIGERDAVVRALAKLEAATGSASAGTSRIQVLIDEGDQPGSHGPGSGGPGCPVGASTCAIWSQAVTSPQSATWTPCG